MADGAAEVERALAPVAALAGQAHRHAGKRAADDAEKSVARHESRVAQIEGQLADADLYDGTAEGARKAAQLDKELAKARRDLDAAMAAWAEAAERN